MFPSAYEFRLDPAHVIFLGAFYTVAALLLGTIVLCAVRAARAVRSGKAEAMLWETEFHELPRSSRICRHQLSGEVRSRTCDHAFDCRACETHGTFPSSRADAVPPAGRFYHRGHTWARPEHDGSVTVGLDDLATRLLGPPDAVELPVPGMHIEVNGTAWRLRKGELELRILSPIDGTVVETGGPDQPFYLRVQPRDGRFTTTHLLRGAEIEPWLLGELDRALATAGEPGFVSLADGGTWVGRPDAAIPEERRDAVLGGLFLDL